MRRGTSDRPLLPAILSPPPVRLYTRYPSATGGSPGARFRHSSFVFSSHIVPKQMLIHPEIDPIAVQIGPLAVRWYGLMYLGRFRDVSAARRYRARQQILKGWNRRISTICCCTAFGVVLAGASATACSISRATTWPIHWKYSQCGRAA